MTDSKDQKKGGFGAFAAREQASHDLREAGTPTPPETAIDTTAAAPAPLPKKA